MPDCCIRRACCENRSWPIRDRSEVRGISLRQLLHRNEAVVRAFVAAARELRRVHQIPCSYYQAAWSHGDLHLDNIVYDPVPTEHF